MRHHLFVLSAVAAFSMLSPVHAADIQMGKKIASTVCAACHGINGVSITAKIPNLAGQKVSYLGSQLKAFKSGKRKHALMNAIAAQVDDTDIENVAAYFASLAGPMVGSQTSEPLEEFVSGRMSFPPNFKDGFTYYQTINFTDRKQVRKYYANQNALTAARDGKPLPDGSVLAVEVFKAKLDTDGKPVMGTDGYFVADKLSVYTAMEKQMDWGSGFPNLLRNGDWNYAVFKSDKSLRQGVNQATCLACHKPLAKDSYIFTLKQLQEVARYCQLDES